MKVYGPLEVAQIEWFTTVGRPAASAYPYRFIWNTTDNAIQVSDGSSWLSNTVPDGSITTVKLADNSVTLAKMTDNSVGTVELVDSSVTTAKILDANVTLAKLSASVQSALNASISPSYVMVAGGNGFGSTNTKIRIFTGIVNNVGSDITYATSATLGDTFTINTAGIYFISYFDWNNSGGFYAGVSLNSSQLTTSIQSITAADALIYSNGASSSLSGSGIFNLSASDVIRAHGDGGADASVNNLTRFIIRRIG